MRNKSQFVVPVATRGKRQPHRAALYPPMRQLDRSLARWADRKYKKLRRHLRKATQWVARISRRDGKLWAHWRMGVGRASMAGSV
jgi:RNA-directed DNA polymerase